MAAWPVGIDLTVHLPLWDNPVLQLDMHPWMKNKLMYEDKFEWTFLKLSIAVIEKEHCLDLSFSFVCNCRFYPPQFYIICFSTPSFSCWLAMCIASPIHSAYANAGINYYANVTVNHYANVTVPTCHTGGKAAYNDLSFPRFFCSRHHL